jgi:hypothetical protein
MAIFQGVIFLSFGVGLLLVSNRDIGTDATHRARRRRLRDTYNIYIIAG